MSRGSPETSDVRATKRSNSSERVSAATQSRKPPSDEPPFNTSKRRGQIRAERSARGLRRNGRDRELLHDATTGSPSLSFPGLPSRELRGNTDPPGRRDSRSGWTPGSRPQAAQALSLARDL